MSDMIRIKFDYQYDLPNGSRHRVGAEMHVRPHIAAAFCDVDGKHGAPFAHRVDGEGNPLPKPEKLAEAPALPDFSKLTVARLKEELAALGLPSTGRKPDLLERLATHYDATDED